MFSYDASRVQNKSDSMHYEFIFDLVLCAMVKIMSIFVHQELKISLFLCMTSSDYV